jgi:hypothetical protein
LAEAFGGCGCSLEPAAAEAGLWSGVTDRCREKTGVPPLAPRSGVTDLENLACGSGDDRCDVDSVDWLSNLAISWLTALFFLLGSPDSLASTLLSFSLSPATGSVSTTDFFGLTAASKLDLSSDTLTDLLFSPLSCTRRSALELSSDPTEALGEVRAPAVHEARSAAVHEARSLAPVRARVSMS